MGFVDLHVHSNASDGTFSPSQVVELAKNAGLDAFALTDHDTTAGVPEALEKGRDLNIEVIPGIEVSSSFDIVVNGKRSRSSAAATKLSLTQRWQLPCTSICPKKANTVLEYC